MHPNFVPIYSWLVCIPADTVKSRYQTAPAGKYSGAGQVFKELWAEGGMAALYRGVGPAMTRAFPANAACFLGVEVAKKVLNRFFPNL